MKGDAFPGPAVGGEVLPRSQGEARPLWQPESGAKMKSNTATPGSGARLGNSEAPSPGTFEGGAPTQPGVCDQPSAPGCAPHPPPNPTHLFATSIITKLVVAGM